MSIRGDIRFLSDKEATECVTAVLSFRRHKVCGGFSEEFRDELIRGSAGLSFNAFIAYASAKIGLYEALANEPEYSI